MRGQPKSDTSRAPKGPKDRHHLFVSGRGSKQKHASKRGVRRGQEAGAPRQGSLASWPLGTPLMTTPSVALPSLIYRSGPRQGRRGLGSQESTNSGAPHHAACSASRETLRRGFILVRKAAPAQSLTRSGAICMVRRDADSWGRRGLALPGARYVKGA